MRGVMVARPPATRAERFTYLGLEVTPNSLRATYDLDGREFEERVDFEGAGDLRQGAARSVAELWYLVAGLSYYKVGAARRIDVGALPLGEEGRALLRAALLDGLGEFAYRNDLPLDDVVVTGGEAVTAVTATDATNRVLVPFGGGIDSVVTSASLPEHLDQSLFVVSPAAGRFRALEETAAVTGFDVVRATKSLDGAVLRTDDEQFRGHVPVTAMVTLLAAVAALSSGRGGVVMSNERSASAANLRWRGRDVNHQWSKSYEAERVLGAAVAERVGPHFTVASLLRDRSEIWVAEVFSRLRPYHHVFRSCNRAFSQTPQRRFSKWCGKCDKCLFVNLMLAPFLDRGELAEIFSSEPLSDPERLEQLRVLVGASGASKPFECVGDPEESAAALVRVGALAQWRDVAALATVAEDLRPTRTFDELLRPEGPHRAPPNWLR